MNTPPPAYPTTGQPALLPPPAYPTTGQSALLPPPAAGGVQTFTYASAKRTYESYNGRHSIPLGGIIIFAGLMCIIFNIISLSITKGEWISVIGYGIWSGVLFIITGVFGIIVARKKTMCKIIGFMVLCVVSSAFCLVLFMLSVTAAVPSSRGYCGGKYHFDKQEYIRHEMSVCSKVAVMEALQACLAVIGTICTIWGSVLCCKAVCCCANTGQVFLPVQYIPMQGNQQMTLYPSQQGGPQGSSTGIIFGGDIPTASGESYNTPDNFPYNPQQYGQRPPIYNEHKVPL